MDENISVKGSKFEIKEVRDALKKFVEFQKWESERKKAAEKTEAMNVCI